MDEPQAALQTIDGRPVLRFERKLAHPPAKVWKAITDPAEMAHWFPAAVDTELKPGAGNTTAHQPGECAGKSPTIRCSAPGSS